MLPYPIAIKNAVKTLCDELEKHYPKVFIKRYDSSVFTSDNENTTFEERMLMCVFIELVKANATLELA